METRTEIEVQELTSSYPLTADGADVITFEAMDPTNGNYYQATGRELILVRNMSEDTAYDLTVTSTPDSIGRTADVVHEIAFGTQVAYFLAVKGWRDSTRRVGLDSEDPGVNPGLEIAVVRLPR